MKIYRDVKDPGALNMAVEEYLMLKARDDNEIIWRFYGPKNCVYIGYFQSVDLEINRQKCIEDKIDIVRRQTGGGAVYCDQELTYSVCIPLNHPFLQSTNIQQTYEQIIDLVIEALEELGVNAVFKPLNDILCDGKKISGNAQTRRHGVLLQHGTILLDVDVDKMFSYLKVSDEKLRAKFVSSVKSVVTGINPLLPKSLTFEELRDFMIEFIAKRLQEFDPEILDLTEEIKTSAKHMFLDKFFTDAWNFKY